MTSALYNKTTASTKYVTSCQSDSVNACMILMVPPFFLSTVWNFLCGLPAHDTKKKEKESRMVVQKTERYGQLVAYIFSMKYLRENGQLLTSWCIQLHTIVNGCISLWKDYSLSDKLPIF